MPEGLMADNSFLVSPRESGCWPEYYHCIPLCGQKNRVKAKKGIRTEGWPSSPGADGAQVSGDRINLPPRGRRTAKMAVPGKGRFS